jgi:hypothetical protein
MNPMKEKLLWATIIVLGVTFTASRAQPPTPPYSPSSPPGRYQLVIGPNPQVAGINQVTTLYRIDTATGETWALNSTYDTSRPNNRGEAAWFHVDEFKPAK